MFGFMKILELFAGIGACSTALKRIGVDVEIVDAVEIDKYAIESFNAIHGTKFEVQDIREWDKDLEVDLITHGSPCQDFSVAGKQAGGDEGSGTRSSLMYETLRIVEKLRPKYVLWENVKNILSEKHRHNFDKYLNRMEELGYKNFYQVLNAKDYGIPQNRERVFTISIRENLNFVFPNREKLDKLPIDYIEKNVDNRYFLTEKNLKHYQRDFGSKGKQVDLLKPIPTLTASMGTGGGNIPYFEFPEPEELKLRLKDMLEDEVDEKYYLNNDKIKKIQNSNFAQEKKRIQDKDYCDTLLARDWKDPKCIQVGELDIKGHDCVKRIYSDKGLSPTLTDMQGGNRQPKVLENLRIRKLTPKECWRLMGFTDEDFEKAKAVPMSNTQLYKQAGNSICVTVLQAIFKNLF